MKRVALGHVAELHAKIGEPTFMCAALERLAVMGHSDSTPDCTILVRLGAGGGRSLPAAACSPFWRDTTYLGHEGAQVWNWRCVEDKSSRRQLADRTITLDLPMVARSM